MTATNQTILPQMSGPAADDLPARLDRRLLMAAIGVVVAATAAIVAPNNLPLLLAVGVTEGVFLLAWLAAAWGVGAWLFDRVARERDASDAILATVTATALGLGALSLATLLLGSAGMLNAATAWLIIGVGLVLAAWRVNRSRILISAWWRAPVGASWSTLLLGVPLGLMGAAALILPGLLWGVDDPAGYDVVAYHLQMPREWFELGRVVALRHNVFSFFPLNVEMHYLLAMHLRGGPFAGMYLAQLMHASFVGLTIAAVCGATRSRGPLAASVAAITCASVPWLPMLGGVAYNEGGLMLYATLAAVWALRGRWGLAGACAGLGAGCKLTGVTAAILIGALFAPLSRWRRARDASDVDGVGERPLPDPLPEEDGAVTRRGPVVRGLILFAAFALLTVSPWLMRTAIASGGNPIFPLAANVLGSAHFDAGQVDRFDAAHAPRPDQRSLAARVRALWTQVGGDYHFGSIALGAHAAIPAWLAVGVIAVVLAIRDQRVRAYALLIVGNVIVWLVATHLQGRFLAHAVPLVALCVGSAVGTQTTGRRVFASIAIVVCVLSGMLTFPTRTLTTNAPALGVPDPSVLRELLPPAVAAAIYDTDRPLILVGDAKAFWYAVPQRRIRYRSVFDVSSTLPFAEAWLGPNPPSDALVIVDPNELARFARTYKNLPPMPPAWRDRREVFVTDISLR